MSLILVADIGGTNARLGVIEYTPNALPDNLQGCVPQRQQTLACAEFPSPAALIRHYCDQQGIAPPRYGCLAIAGPVDGRQVQMTNHNWLFSADTLGAELGMEQLEVMNDFAACAYSVPHLGPNDVHVLYPAQARADAPIAILGPGTGFGAAALVPTPAGPQVITGEGGHVNFAPGTAREIGILQVLLTQQAHVSVENLVSGAGLVNVYRALCSLDDHPAQSLSAAQISDLGRSANDPYCREALQQFCALLGSVIGDKALTYGALGGIYIGGGITPRLVDFLPQTDFLARLQHKGPMTGYLQRIPVQVITHPTAALLGAGAWIIGKLVQAQSSRAE